MIGIISVVLLFLCVYIIIIIIAIIIIFITITIIFLDARISNGSTLHTPIYSTNGPASDARQIAEQNKIKNMITNEQILDKELNLNINNINMNLNIKREIDMELERQREKEIGRDGSGSGSGGGMEGIDLNRIKSSSSSWLPDNPNQHPGKRN